MVKRLIVGAAALIVLVGALLYLRAQAIFSSDLVRTNVAAQLSRALGQPVDIGAIGATVLPRVTMVLSDVRIGNPVAITLARLDVGASARALLSRRIEDATLRVEGARMALPLPPFTIGGGEAAGGDTSTVSIDSIEEIVLNDVAISSGGRTLRGDIRLVPSGAGLRVDRMSLRLDDTRVDITGHIASLDGPVGTLTLAAASLDMLALQAFATDFASGAGLGPTSPTGTPAPTPPGAPMNLHVVMTADRATFGTLTLDGLSGTARLTDEQFSIDDISFGLFEGRYAGAVTLGLASTPAFQMKGTLADVSMNALTTWAGQPGAMTGRLAGRVDATGSGTTADAVIASTKGSARIDVTQGTVQGLALVRTLVVGASMRADTARAAGDGSEAFSRLGASFAIGGGIARTNDLTFESTDVSFEGAGQVGLDGSNIDLAGRVRLSEALTQQAGRDLVRYTQEGGRVTVPVSISGSAGNLSVRPETADVLKRAITNKAVEEAGEAIRRGLGGLFGRGE